MRISTLFCTFLLAVVVTFAQRNHVLRNDIHTLRTEIDGNLASLPVLMLGGKDKVRFGFDRMSHEYRRFFYRVEHCGFDWEKTPDLFENEYLESNLTDILIEEHRESRNTNVQYTHYAFSFPDKDVRPLVSGNYRITIYDDTAERPEAVAVVHCCVAEPLVNIGGRVETDTDIDRNGEHQQLSLRIDASALNARDLREELKTVVYQNERWDNAVWNAPPTHVNAGVLLWQHQPRLIFKAGNEYRRFELVNMRMPGMRVESLRWFPPYHHATLLTDEIRRNYLLIEDRNGTSVIRNTDNLDNETESEYLFVHFSVETEPFEQADVYIDGRWCDTFRQPEHRMAYNHERGCYEGVLFLKQGYYNYRYLVRTKGKEQSETAPIEGDFHNTENLYAVMAYFRSPTDRYDRLVGIANIKS